MNIPVAKHRPTNSLEIRRFLLVGIVATVVHFAVLVFLRDMVGVHIALAGWFGSVIGIITSYCGNAVWVYQAGNTSVEAAGSTRSNLRGSTAFRFIVLYALISIGHGLGLWLWTLVTAWPYQLGFCALTLLSAITTYFGNKHFVFAAEVSAGSP